MKKLSILLIFLASASLAIGDSLSEEFLKWPKPETPDTSISESEKKDSTATTIVLIPETDPYNMYTSSYSERREYVNTGFIFGSYGMGLEGIYRPEQSSVFAGLVAISPSGSALSENEANLSMFLGATVGYHLPFMRSHPRYRLQGEPESFHFYARMAPGLGFASLRRVNSRERSGTEREIGLFLNGAGGMIVPFSERSQFYTELGWKGFWFPGADDLGFLGGPTLTIGFTFSFGGGVTPVRF